MNAQGQPYTYEQYSRMYAAPTENAQPMTTRGYYHSRSHISPTQEAAEVKPPVQAVPPE